MNTPSSPRYTLDTYPHRSPPFAHQTQALRVSYKKRAFALFMDPGTGKTRIAIDTAALWFMAGHITGMVVAAPNDVHAQWVEEQIPQHMPTCVKTRCVVWDGAKMLTSKRTRQPSRALRAAQELCTHPLPDRLHVLALNHEALATKKGVALVRAFLKAHRTLFILDESHAFKSHTTKRTKRAVALAPLAFGRRLLTGTETDGNPFDYYSQMEFLDPRILNQDSFLAFKHRYGVWQKEWARHKTKLDPKTGKPKLYQYETLQDFQRLEELASRLSPFVFRVKKRDCLDLPPVLPARIPTHLSTAQREVYAALVDQAVVLLQQVEAGKRVQVMDLAALTDEELVVRVANDRDRMSMKIKLVMNLRLQQCAGGFVTDDTGRVSMIDGQWDACPPLLSTAQKVQELLRAVEGKIIVWAMFKAELRALELAINELHHHRPNTVIRIDGSVTGAERDAAIKAFKQQGRGPRVLVAHPRTMGTGQNLQVASEMIFYSSPWSSILRQQAQDRIDRIGQAAQHVTMYDVVARDCPITMDVLETHSSKQSFNDRFARMTAEAYRIRMQFKDHAHTHSST